MARPLLLLRSVAFAFAFYPLTILFVIAAAVAAPFSERGLRGVTARWGGVHRALCRLILGQRVVVEGELPKGAYFYVFKHESMFETIDLVCLFDAPLPIAKRELLDIPGWGRMAARFGVIGIDRQAGASALRHLKTDVAKAATLGRPICLFPEGTRVPHGESPPLKPGFAALYKLLGLPVVPVAVDSGLVSPRNSFLKRPGTIRYRVGALVPPGLPRPEAEARVHAAINALNADAGQAGGSC